MLNGLKAGGQVYIPAKSKWFFTVDLIVFSDCPLYKVNRKNQSILLFFILPCTWCGNLVFSSLTNASRPGCFFWCSTLAFNHLFFIIAS